MVYLQLGVILLASLAHAQDVDPGKADEGKEPQCNGAVPLHLLWPYTHYYHMDATSDLLTVAGSPFPKIDNVWFKDRWSVETTPDDPIIKFVQRGVDNGSIRATDEEEFGWQRIPKPTQKISLQFKINSVELGKTALAINDQLEAGYKKDNIIMNNKPAIKHQRGFTVTMEKAKDLGRIGTILEEACRKILNDQDAEANDMQLVEEPEMCKAAGHKPAKIQCDSKAPYRTPDGSCNNLVNVEMGMSFQCFRRLLPPDYSDKEGVKDPREAKDGSELVSARTVSVALKNFPRKMSECFSAFLMSFGQFLDHDLTSTPAAKAGDDLLPCCHPDVLQDPAKQHPDCFPIIIDPDDAFYSTYGIGCMEFVRSVKCPICSIGSRQQMNQVTSYIDGSAVYGSSKEEMDSLRSFKRGRLDVSVNGEEELLPASNAHDGCSEGERMNGRPCFRSGDARVNEHLLLAFLTTLFMREHNRIAKELGKLHPDWNDEKLFQETRRIVIAILQHIAYNEFLPGVIGPLLVNALGLKPLRDDEFYTGYDEKVSAAISNAFATAAFRMGHSMVPEILIKKVNGKYRIISTNDIIFSPFDMYDNDGLASIMHGACTQSTEFVDKVFARQISNMLFRPDGDIVGLDLVALNIQRGRDHGLPGYTAFRKACGFKKAIKTFDDLKGIFEDDVIAMFKKLYKHVEDIDLFPAAMSETALPGGLVGPTFACIISDQFIRLKKGDRFFYEHKGQAGSFTPEQLRELHKASFARVMCDNFPAIQRVQRWAFQLPGALNPEVSCDSLCIPKLDLTRWL